MNQKHADWNAYKRSRRSSPPGTEIYWKSLHYGGILKAKTDWRRAGKIHGGKIIEALGIEAPAEQFRNEVKE